MYIFAIAADKHFVYEFPLSIREKDGKVALQNSYFNRDII